MIRSEHARRGEKKSLTKFWAFWVPTLELFASAFVRLTDQDSVSAVRSQASSSSF